MFALHSLDQSGHRLQREDSVAEGSNLLVLSEPVSGVGNPAGFETHEPFHKRGCQTRTSAVV